MQMIKREERQKILRDAGITLDVSAEDGVAMKTALGIPWNKIRHIRRFAMSKTF